MQKQYITAETLFNDALELALMIAEQGYEPDLIVGVWRGGTPVGIVVQEVLEFTGIRSDHIAIRTASYTGIAARTQVQVHGLEYLRNKLTASQSLLLVDDVYDTGLSLHQVIEELRLIYREALPQIKIATPYFKPGNNRSPRKPDFYLHETADWLVFPHELMGLSDEEILQHKPGIAPFRQRLLNLRKN